MIPLTDQPVSAHAVDRYIERIDPDADWVETRKMMEQYACIGTGMVRLPCGARLVVRDNCVVTVKPGFKRSGKSPKRRNGQRKSM